MTTRNRSRRNAPINMVESAYQLLLDLQIVRSFAEFGREVSGSLNREDSMQRWNDWRHGRRPIPRDVQTYLLDLALGHALSSELGMTDIDVIERHVHLILPHLLPPQRSHR